MQKSWKATTGGVLAIVAGAINLLVALGISLFVPVAATPRLALASVGVLAGVFLVTGIVALVGGILALQRRSWGVSLAGAICAMMPPATLLGILSTVFVALARDEFSADSGTGSVSVTEPTAVEGCGCKPAFDQPSEAERNA
jgi:hypothetical protein